MVVVVAGQGLVEGEVLLDDLRAEQVGGGERHHGGVGRDVVGEADLDAREVAP